MCSLSSCNQIAAAARLDALCGLRKARWHYLSEFKYEIKAEKEGIHKSGFFFSLYENNNGVI